jgi:hypothetical protein
MKRLWGRKVSDLGFGAFMQKIQWQAHKRDQTFILKLLFEVSDGE